MHNEVKKLVANNIEVNYILFSRNEEDEDAYNEMVSVWCSDNQIKSLDMVFNNSSITAKTCDNPIKNNYIKARDLRVNGTPMIFTENGLVVPGYVSSDKLIEILEKSAN